MTCTLADLTEFIIDTKHATPTYVDDGYPCIRTPNIGRGFFILDGVKRVSEETYQVWIERAEPTPGDLVLAREAPVGNVATIPPGFRLCIGQRTVLIRPRSDLVCSRFLTYLLLGDETQNRMNSVASGATVPHLNMSDIRALALPELPDLPTQRKISTILSAYDDLIENNRRRIQILEEMAQNLYREWFVKFRFPGHESVRMVDSELGEIPEGWEVRTLGESVELCYGKGLKKDDRKPGAVAVYGSSGVVGWHNEALVAGPGIIVGRKGNVGSIHWSHLDFFPIDTVFFVNTGLPLHYVYYNLKNQNFINSDAAVPGLNRNQAYSLPFIVPGDETLGRFTGVIDPVFSLAWALSRKNDVLRETRDLLLPRLISGELDVSDLNIAIPEEAA